MAYWVRVLKDWHLALPFGSEKAICGPKCRTVQVYELAYD